MPRPVKGFLRGNSQSAQADSAKRSRKKRRVNIDIPTRRHIIEQDQDLATNRSNPTRTEVLAIEARDVLDERTVVSDVFDQERESRAQVTESEGHISVTHPPAEEGTASPNSDAWQGEFDRDEDRLEDENVDENSQSEGEFKDIPVIDHWQKLLPTLAVNGSVKLTRSQYECLLRMCNFFNATRSPHWKSKKFGNQEAQLPQDPYSDSDRIPVFPSFRTIQRGIKATVLSKLTVRGHDEWHDLDFSKAGVQVQAFTHDSISNIEALGKVKIRLVPVSEYARADVACPIVYEQMKSTALESFCTEQDCENGVRIVEPPQRAGCKSWDCVDDWPLIADREGFYGASIPIGIDESRTDQSETKTIEAGDILLVTAMEGDLHADLKCRFHYNATEEHCEQNAVAGTVIASWSATEAVQDSETHPRRILRDLSNYEYEIIEAFHVRATNEATFPGICRGGDTLTLLRAPDPGFPSWILLVHRFIQNLGANDGSCFFLWIKRNNRSNEGNSNCDNANLEENNDTETWKGFSILSPFTAQIQAPSADFCNTCARVKTLRIAKTHGGQRGAARARPISSTGVTSDGMRYFIYRFMLFWDGFRITEGKAASGTGVYMVSLNLPSHCRGGTAAVRVLTLIPPGARFQEVFSRLQEDIVRGMVEGFTDYDADGKLVRIFLDYVCNCGDTPALNEAVDVLGHQAGACCHLCRFFRGNLETVKVGKDEFVRTSRYTGTDVHSAKEFARRDMVRHRAAYMEDVSDETRNRLGFKPSDFEGIRGLHELAKCFDSIKEKVPKDRNETPVLPSVLDPYHSLLIGPDHLLTGHCKDCINAALVILSPSLRLRYEMFAISAMKDCGLPTQNRLVDRKSGRLFAMSLSDLYTLLFVSEYAFCKAILPDEGEESLGGRIRHIVEIIGKYSRLVSDLCYLPIQCIDGLVAFNAFNESLGLTRIWNQQRKVRAHLQSLQELCTISAELPRKLRELSRARLVRVEKERERKRLIRDAKEANLARSELDHPNVHRLLEMSQTVLPMVGHISRVSELVFEKAHQQLKRAIKQSNNRNPEPHAMKAAVFNDWQGRLAMCKNDLNSLDPERKRRAQLALFRLLRGREEVYALKAKLRSREVEFVENAFGPPETVDEFLEAEGRKVLSVEKNPGNSRISWKIAINKYEQREAPCSFSFRTTDSILSINLRFEAYQSNGVSFLDSVYGKDEYRLGSEAYSLYESGSKVKQSYSLRAGVVVQALTATQVACSFSKFIRLLSTYGEGENSGTTTYWYLLSFFETKTGSGALALPCKLMDSRNEHLSVADSGIQPLEPKFDLFKVEHPADQVPYILKLDASCRRVAVLHNCKNSCERGSKEMFLKHAEHIMEASFYIVDRKSGYPPRRV